MALFFRPLQRLLFVLSRDQQWVPILMVEVEVEVVWVWKEERREREHQSQERTVFLGAHLAFSGFSIWRKSYRVLLCVRGHSWYYF